MTFFSTVEECGMGTPDISERRTQILAGPRTMSLISYPGMLPLGMVIGHFVRVFFGCRLNGFDGEAV